MTQPNDNDSVDKRYEALAAKPNITAQELMESLPINELDSLETQVAYFEERSARAKANPERVQKALAKVFEGLSLEDDIPLDPKKIKAMSEEQEKNHEYNMKIYKQKHPNAAFYMLNPQDEKKN